MKKILIVLSVLIALFMGSLSVFADEIIEDQSSIVPQNPVTMCSWPGFDEE